MATVRAVAAPRPNLQVRCVPPRDILPAKISFVAIDNQAPRGNENIQLEAPLVVRVDGKAFELKGQYSKTLFGTTLRSLPEFADGSMSVLEAMQQAKDSIEVSAADISYSFPVLGIGSVLERLLAVCMGKPDPAKPAPRQEMADFDCAVSYWLFGAFRMTDDATALGRANMALDRYQAVNPGLNRSRLDLEKDVISRGQARGARIQQRQESVENVTTEVRACESRYGLLR